MTALALAIVALVVFWSVAVATVFEVPGKGNGALALATTLAGVILGVSAVVTGVIARRRVRRGQGARGGVALAGIVLGVVAAAVPAVLTAWVVYVFFTQYQEFEQCIRIPESVSPRYLCLKQCPGILDSLCRSEIGW